MLGLGFQFTASGSRRLAQAACGGSKHWPPSNQREHRNEKTTHFRTRSHDEHCLRMFPSPAVTTARNSCRGRDRNCGRLDGLNMPNHFPIGISKFPRVAGAGSGSLELRIDRPSGSGACTADGRTTTGLTLAFPLASAVADRGDMLFQPKYRIRNHGLHGFLENYEKSAHHLMGERGSSQDQL
jgi:hypothetical protein